MIGLPKTNKLFGFLSIYSLLIVLGMALAILLAQREEKRLKLPKDTVIDAALLAIPTGIIGARLYYVLFTLDAFKAQPWKVFFVWEGGLGIYGGLITAIIALFLFAKKRKLSFLLLLDILVPGVALAQSIGRWGNYFNMEAYGYQITNPAWQFFPFGVPIIQGGQLTWHLATFFYESLCTFIIFLILYALQKKKRYNGEVFFWYLLLYGAIRAVIEGLRSDSLYTTSAFRISQIVGLLSCLIVFVWLIAKAWQKKPRGSALLFIFAALYSAFELLCFWGWGRVFTPQWLQIALPALWLILLLALLIKSRLSFAQWKIPTLLNLLALALFPLLAPMNPLIFTTIFVALHMALYPCLCLWLTAATYKQGE